MGPARRYASYHPYGPVAGVGGVPKAAGGVADYDRFMCETVLSSVLQLASGGDG